MPPLRLTGHLPLLAGLGALACASQQPAPTPVPAAPISRPAPAVGATSSAPVEPAALRCGDLRCERFDSAAEAFATLLEARPLVIAVGESHAKKGTEGVPSATSRFTNELLPLFAGKASDLVLELWVADGACGQQEKQVAEEQKPVTTHQRESNQNEFVTLGNRSNELGIRPHVLRPSCEEYQKIVEAGPDGIQQMLTMIAEMTDRMLQAILVRNAKGGKEQIAIAYGGAMHNDLQPRPGREPFSFGPQQFAHTAGRYVEVDLIVPEFIGDSEVWRALPWYDHFDPTASPDQVTLLEVQPGSYVLVFARTNSAASADDGSERRLQ